MPPMNGGDQLMWPSSFMSARSVQSITETPPPHQAQNMRLSRITGGPCSMQTCSGSACLRALAASLPSFCQGSPQMLTISGLSGSRMSRVQITRLSQPSALQGRSASWRWLSTPKRCGPSPGMS